MVQQDLILNHCFHSLTKVLRPFESMTMMRKEQEHRWLMMNDERHSRDVVKFVLFHNESNLRWLDLVETMHCVSLEEDLFLEGIELDQ